MKVIVKRRQSLADLAMQEYGDIRGAVEIAVANGIDVTAELESGAELDCPDTIFDPYIKDYVRKNSITPATELSELDNIQARIFTEQFTEEFI